MSPQSTNTVRISNATVHLVEKITWGIQEKIRGAMYSGIKPNLSKENQSNGVEFDMSAIQEAKYKAFELCILKIVQDDNSEIAYSREWIDNLSIEDGDAVSESVDKLTETKKK